MSGIIITCIRGFWIAGSHLQEQSKDPQTNHIDLSSALINISSRPNEDLVFKSNCPA